METSYRFSTKNIKIQVYLLTAFLFLVAFALIKVFPPSLKVIILDVLFAGCFRCLFILHESAHAGWACLHGVPCSQINLMPNGRSYVELYNVPKEAWPGVLLFPLAIPVMLAIFGIAAPAALPLSVITMAGSASDIVIWWKTRKLDGNYVTRIGDEIVVTFSPFPALKITQHSLP